MALEGAMSWIDLTAILGRLEGDRRYIPLEGQIRRLWSLYAVYADLKFSRMAIERLMSQAPNAGPIHQATESEDAAVSDALLTNAVISYCRAVHSKATSGRFDMLGTRHFDEEQKSQHKLVVAIRNQAIAHHGYGEIHPRLPWLQDRLVIRFNKHSANLRAPYIRLNTSVEVMEALDALTTASIRRYESLEPKMRDDTIMAIREMMHRDANFRSIMERHPFDGAAFFGDHPGWNHDVADFTRPLGEERHWVRKP